MTTFQPDGPRADAAVFDVSRDHVTDWLTRTGDPAAEAPTGEQIATGMWATDAWDPEAADTVSQARGLTISRDRAVQILEEHGYDETDLGRQRQADMEADFFGEVGDRDHYAASEVVDYLGY